VSPSDEKRISFWVRERWIRSFVRGQIEAVRDSGDSQPDLWVGVSECFDLSDTEVGEVWIPRYWGRMR